MIVNGSIFGTVDTSLAYECPHKNCLVCIVCAKKSLPTGEDTCPACKGAMPLVDHKSAVDRAEALIKSKMTLLGHDPAAASSKRAWEPGDTDDEMEEEELEENDIDADMLALEEIANETAHQVVKTFPVNLTEPEKLWTTEVGFYEKLRNLYQPGQQTSGDRYSLYFTVACGWARTLPLHILIGDKYLINILRLAPTVSGERSPSKNRVQPAL